MLLRGLIFFLCLTLCGNCQKFTDPQDQIVVIEDFIPSDIAKILMEFYKKKKTVLQVQSDNQLALIDISSCKIQKIFSDISSHILDLMESCYRISKKKYHLDHGGIYARIPGNFCSYHADNGQFHCPIHGKDQSLLRKICNGDCAGSQFVPNHTYWREYTALIYLNDDFEGGEIVFEDGPCNKIYHKVIPIKANMLILAPNGQNFYHEVHPIKKQTRYSIHLWYTSDKGHQFFLPKCVFP